MSDDNPYESPNDIAEDRERGGFETTKRVILSVFILILSIPATLTAFYVTCTAASIVFDPLAWPTNLSPDSEEVRHFQIVWINVVISVAFGIAGGALAVWAMYRLFKRVNRSKRITAEGTSQNSSDTQP